MATVTARTTGTPRPSPHVRYRFALLTRGTVEAGRGPSVPETPPLHLFGIVASPARPSPGGVLPHRKGSCLTSQREPGPIPTRRADHGRTARRSSLTIRRVSAGATTASAPNTAAPVSPLPPP